VSLSSRYLYIKPIETINSRQALEVEKEVQTINLALLDDLERSLRETDLSLKRDHVLQGGKPTATGSDTEVEEGTG
jgi:hypothetical protein